MVKFIIILAVFAVSYAHALGLSSDESDLAFRISGELASIESFPYHVSVHYHNHTKCSGAIISNEWVLTSATCFINPPTEKASIRAGSTLRFQDGSEHEVDKIIIHPKRDPKVNLYRYDIALVHVKNPFHFDKTRQPISMFEMDEKVKPGTTGVFTGWGVRLTNPEKYLHTEELTIVSKLACDAYFGENIDMEDEVCVVYQIEHYENPCTANYGSPLTINGRLAGIGSLRTMYCGISLENDPVFHTEVAAYRPWIKNVTGI